MTDEMNRWKRFCLTYGLSVALGKFILFVGIKEMRIQLITASVCLVNNQQIYHLLDILKWFVFIALIIYIKGMWNDFFKKVVQSTSF